MRMRLFRRARPSPDLGVDRVAELETAWAKRTQAWERKRLQVIRLVAQHKLNAAEIAAAVEAGKATVFRYISAFIKGWGAALRKREHKGGRAGALKAEDYEAFLNELSAGRVAMLDEQRCGLLPVIRRCWGLRGVGGHAPYATKYPCGSLYEAVEVNGADRMALFFSPSVAPG